MGGEKRGRGGGGAGMLLFVSLFNYFSIFQLFFKFFQLFFNFVSTIFQLFINLFSTYSRGKAGFPFPPPPSLPPPPPPPPSAFFKPFSTFCRAPRFPELNFLLNFFSTFSNFFLKKVEKLSLVSSTFRKYWNQLDSTLFQLSIIPS